MRLLAVLLALFVSAQDLCAQGRGRGGDDERQHGRRERMSDEDRQRIADVASGLDKIERQSLP